MPVSLYLIGYNGVFVDDLHMTHPATNLTPTSGISHWGKKG